MAVGTGRVRVATGCGVSVGRDWVLVAAVGSVGVETRRPPDAGCAVPRDEADVTVPPSPTARASVAGLGMLVGTLSACLGKRGRTTRVPTTMHRTRATSPPTSADTSELRDMRGLGDGVGWTRGRDATTPAP